MISFARVAAIGGGFLGATAGLAGVAALAALRAPLPRMSGTLHLDGLGTTVEVVRDHWGVPHIYAASNADLFMAQGYVHAQDRLWQMELQRRVGHGRLAEMFGPRALEADRFLRILGFGRVAREEAARLEGATRESVESYVSGVNTYLAQNRRLPLEFTVLRLRPRPWTAADALVFGKVMALNLSENWTGEILRARIVAAVGAERAAALEPSYPEEHPLAIPPGVRYRADIGAEAVRGAAAAASFTDSGEMVQGSNSWAVAGTRTTTGQPLLASDPHLALSMPSLWYENHLDGGDYHVTGASIPGTPGVIIGHNERIAWGMTNGMTDVQDLYIEQFDPADATRYQFRDQWEQATVVREEIVVRGQSDPVVEEVRLTRHGPLITPLAGQAHRASTEAEQPLALRWTALQPGRLIDAVLAMNRAHDWESFRDALSRWTVPAQNFTYADVDGHIGYSLGGDIPIRAAGDGRLPVPGWSGEHEWLGIIPHAELPHVLDPDDDCVVTANNRIVDETYHHAIEAEWLPGYRAARIRALLEETPRHDVISFARIHGDQLSGPGLQVAALAERLPARTTVEQQARAALACWDGVLSADSVVGTVYARLCAKLMAEAYAEIAGPLGIVTGLGTLATLPGDGFLERALPNVLRRAAERDDDWLPAGRTWDGVLCAAWSAAIQELRDAHGDDVTAWRYGRVHTLTLRHLLGVVPLLEKLLNRGPFPTGGDINTVCMGYLMRQVNGPPLYVAPSYRQICDSACWDRSVSIQPTGQSGHPASPHYADFVSSWLDIRYHPMLWSRTEVNKAAAQQLTLAP